MANEEATGGGCKRTCRTVVQAVTPLFLCLFPWWFMLLPLNPFSSVSAAVRRSSAAVASLQMRTNYIFVETPSIDRTPHLAVEPFLSSGN